jgi:PAS domain-containing protein
MKICDITRNIGDFTRDCILITKAEPWAAPDGPEIVWCNAAFTEMTGYTLDDVKGKTPRILQGPDTPREPLDLIRSSL